MEKLSLRVMDIEADEGYLNELLKEVEDKLGASIPNSLLEALNESNADNSAACGNTTPMNAPHGESVNRRGCPKQTGGGKIFHFGDNASGGGDERDPSTEKAGDLFPAGMDTKLVQLRTELMALREMDAKLMFQLLAINDEIEEFKWIQENLELVNSKESLCNSRNSSRESLHEKWLEMRSLAALTSSESLVSSRLSLTREGSRRRLWFNYPAASAREQSKYSKIKGNGDYSPPKDNYLMGRRGSSGELLKISPPVFTISKKRRSSLDFCTSPVETLSPTNNNHLYEIEIKNEDITPL